MKLLLPILVITILISGMAFPTYAEQSENPVVTWNKLTGQLGLQYSHGPPDLARDYVLVHVAMYDALLFATTNNVDASEAAIVAGAASEVLKHLFPANAEDIASMESSQIDNIDGYTNDQIQQGLNLGHIVGKKVVDYAKTDGYDTPWDGNIPVGDCKWIGNNPIGPKFGKVKTFILTTWNEFPVEAPPACDSTEYDAEIQLIIDVNTNLTPEQEDIAKKWEPIPALIHNDQLNERTISHNLSIFDAAHAAVYVNIASHDSMVSVWHTKYDYWTARPFHQINFVPVIVTPNFPGYPSGHSTAAPSTALVLGALFPEDKDQLLLDAQENALSRLYGGVHFNIDDEVGYELGLKIGNKIVNDMLGPPHPFIYGQTLVGGQFLLIDNYALLLAGIQSSAIWNLPAIAGTAGAGIYYIKKRMNKN